MKTDIKTINLESLHKATVARQNLLDLGFDSLVGVLDSMFYLSLGVPLAPSVLEKKGGVVYESKHIHAPE